MNAVGGMLVRPAERTDARRLAEINVETWRHAYAELVPSTYLDALDIETMHDRWMERLAPPEDDRVSYVAEIDGRLAAYAVGGTYRPQQDAEPEDTSRWGELFAIYTDPTLQGRGAGTGVHDAVLDSLGRRGLTMAALWVLKGNVSTIRWYAERHWRPDGATSNWLGAGEPLEEIRLVHLLPGGSSRIG